MPRGWSQRRLSWADPRLGICIPDCRHRGVTVDFSLSSELGVRSVNRALEKLLTPVPSRVQWAIITGIRVPAFSYN